MIFQMASIQKWSNYSKLSAKRNARDHQKTKPRPPKNPKKTEKKKAKKGSAKRKDETLTKGTRLTWFFGDGGNFSGKIVACLLITCGILERVLLGRFFFVPKKKPFEETFLGQDASVCTRSPGDRALLRFQIRRNGAQQEIHALVGGRKSCPNQIGTTTHFLKAELWTKRKKSTLRFFFWKHVHRREWW